MYILREQRLSNEQEAFHRYRTFLHENRDKFPTSVFNLATSDWYFDPAQHKCPHDAWLDSFTVEDPATDNENGISHVKMRLVLEAPYHDGRIEYVYHDVSRYLLEGFAVDKGHFDWSYDEFRLSEDGKVVHEIEWSGQSRTARWIIEAENITYNWHDEE